jgi:hypothetical protein
VTLPRFINFAFGVSPPSWTVDRTDEQIATTFLGVHLLTSYQNPPEEQEGDETDSQTRSTPRQQPILLDDEQTPLLVPVTPRDQNPLLRRISGTPSSSAVPPQIRVIRKTSNADLTSTLGINTQAGFLLMATTPPAGSSFGTRAKLENRSRSGRDVERGSLGRGVSYASTRRGS